MASQTKNLTGTLTSIADGEPKEGRKIISFLPAIDFITGLEIFSWNSKSLGNTPLTSIQSMWVDASNVGSSVAGPQNILIKAGGRLIKLDIPGNATNPTDNIGQDPLTGFFLVPSAMPFELDVSCTIDAVGPVIINLYNFNVFALGFHDVADKIDAYLKQLRGQKHINTGK